jgi:hypothetical protein
MKQWRDCFKETPGKRTSCPNNGNELQHQNFWLNVTVTERAFVPIMPIGSDNRREPTARVDQKSLIARSMGRPSRDKLG